jgi:carbamoyl-phosphate synthase large subunit
MLLTSRAVVTGAAGVIGRALVARLAISGVEVRAIDVQPRPYWLPQDVDYVQADLRHIDPSAFLRWEPDVVYHLAATFERSVEDPTFWRDNAEHNILLSHNVLRACERIGGLRRIVFASSYLVYDPSLYLGPQAPSSPRALVEDDVLRPRNLCGFAKLLHERELEASESRANAAFTSISARIFRVYGRGSRDVVSRWVRSALANEPICVYGQESFFDYIHADDVALGLMLLAESNGRGPINLGSGRAHRVADVVDILRSQFDGLRVELSVEPPSDFERSQASVIDLAATTGWVPETRLDDGIASLVDHERSLKARGGFSRRVRTAPSVGVLITSASRKTPLLRAFREAFLSLNVAGTVWAADIDARVPAANEADQFWTMPPIGELDPSDVADFCVSNGIQVVVPTRDGELTWWANAAQALASAGVYAAVGSAQCVSICDDKLAFSVACQGLDIRPVPTATDLDSIPGDHLVVKERRGAGSVGVALDISRTAALALSQSFIEPIFQPYLPGRELTIDCYVRQDGAALGTVARWRDVVWGGESQVTTVTNHPAIEMASSRLATSLGVRGHAVLQAIVSEDGFWMLECNPRMGGASTAAFAAGLTSAHYLVQEALGESPDPAYVIRSELRMVRCPSDRIIFPGS